MEMADIYIYIGTRSIFAIKSFIDNVLVVDETCS